MHVSDPSTEADEPASDRLVTAVEQFRHFGLDADPNTSRILAGDDGPA
jgi:hypothetical protein